MAGETKLRHRNLGKFFINKTLIDQNFDKVKEVLSHMVVIECSYRPEADWFVYVAISSLFDVIEDDETIPGYDLKFDGAGKLIATRKQ